MRFNTHREENDIYILNAFEFTHAFIYAKSEARRGNALRQVSWRTPRPCPILGLAADSGQSNYISGPLIPYVLTACSVSKGAVDTGTRWELAQLSKNLLITR